VKKDDKEIYYGDQYDINNKSKSYWLKLPVAVIDKALEESIASHTVCMIDVQIDRFENVLPMVPAGGTLYNMMLEYKE
jgi:hypothetical protein